MAKSKKADEGAPQRPKTIQQVDTAQFLSVLEGTLGGEGVILQRAQHMESRLDLRRPSGIVSLDIACGGGLPPGLQQIDGKDSVGKNLLLYHYMAHCQRVYGEKTNIGMLCFESNMDKLFARKCGLRIALSAYEIGVEERKRASKGKPPLTKDEIKFLSTDQVGEIHVIRGSNAEKMLQAAVGMIALNQYQIIGVDSWDAMLPQDSSAKELEDGDKVANSANIQTRWMSRVFGALTPRKICPSCGSFNLEYKRGKEGAYSYNCVCKWKGTLPYMLENETTIIGIRQVRANMNKGGMHARDYAVGGSHALRHGKIIDIQLRTGDRIMEGKRKIGKEVCWELTKGKAGTHEGLIGSYTYYYKPPRIAVGDDLVNLALAAGIVKQAGSLGYTYKGKSLGKRADLADKIGKDPELFRSIRRRVLAHHDLGHIRYT